MTCLKTAEAVWQTYTYHLEMATSTKESCLDTFCISQFSFHYGSRIVISHFFFSSLIIPLICDCISGCIFGREQLFPLLSTVGANTSGSHEDCFASVTDVRTSEIAHHLAKPCRLLVIQHRCLNISILK